MKIEQVEEKDEIFLFILPKRADSGNQLLIYSKDHSHGTAAHARHQHSPPNHKSFYRCERKLFQQCLSSFLMENTSIISARLPFRTASFPEAGPEAAGKLSARFSRRAPLSFLRRLTGPSAPMRRAPLTLAYENIF